jgi:hypothetical protein
MGGRRIPGAQTLAIAAAGALVAVACGGNNAAPSPSASPSGQPTAAATASPSPSPTPDPLGHEPATRQEAIEALDRYLATVPAGFCPVRLAQAWDALCRAGDFDGDGQRDLAILVPLRPETRRIEHPAVVLVKRTGHSGWAEFPLSGDADASPLGRRLFEVGDRTGRGQGVTLLTTGCSATACASVVQVQWWDGTAWRDAGPGEQNAIAELKEASFTGQGAESVLTTYGGVISAAGAGPQRAVTTTFRFDGARYAVAARRPDPTEYLYHAIADADALFAAGDWAAAAAAYQRAIGDASLKDWKLERGLQPGRPDLEGYARVRIAIAVAAAREDPTVALDAAIAAAPGSLWSHAAEAFRKGHRESNGNLNAACRETTTYLANAPIPQLIREAFDYGYTNPIKTYRDICPL